MFKSFDRFVNTPEAHLVFRDLLVLNHSDLRAECAAKHPGFGDLGFRVSGEFGAYGV